MDSEEKRIAVHWTQPARESIYDIMDFMIEEQKIPLHIVDRLIAQIFGRTKILEMFPKTGEREPLLEDRDREYRFLTEGDFKIIYHPTPSTAYIATVFNTRQDTQKLTRKVSEAERRNWKE